MPGLIDCDVHASSPAMVFTRPGLLADARARGAAAACSGRRLDFDGTLRSVAAPHQAGIPVLAGTDAPKPIPTTRRLGRSSSS
jgi:hypothetical protein